jgi:type I restriction enzyme S subunit
LTGETLKELRLPLPTPDDQRTIAEYLDHRTAHIDALIAAKRRLVELLTDQRQQAIAQMLLGRPRPGRGPGSDQVTLREGWTLVPFRRLFREVDERSTTGSERLLAVSQTRGVIPQSDLGDRRQYAETLVGYKICRPGDLVINRMWVYYGALGASRHYGLVSPDYAVFRPTAEMSSAFAAYVLRTDAYVAEMTRLVRGIGAAFQGAVRKPRLHPEELGLIALPVPPSDQQEALLTSLDQQTADNGTKATLLQRSIDLLAERRQALITAAVAGHLEVPVAA